jgi:uncharacterized protein YdaU (DUF1376 family)
MKVSKSPAFQFYPKEWLSSMDIMLMTPEQEGAYIRLLCLCWESGDCSIPDDDHQLAMLCRLGEGWFKGSSTVVRKKFIPHPNKPGFLTNDRLIKEANKQADWAQKCSNGGKKSAEKRAEQQSKSKGGSRVVEGYLENSTNYSSTLQSSVSSLHTPVTIPPTPKGDEVKPRKEKHLEQMSDDFITFWQSYPRKTGKRLAWEAWKNIDCPQLQVILVSIRKARQSPDWQKERGAFIPHPATWLNQARWEDEGMDYAALAGKRDTGHSSAQERPIQVDEQDALSWLEDNYSVSDRTITFKEWPKDIQSQYLNSKQLEAA